MKKIALSPKEYKWVIDYLQAGKEGLFVIHYPKASDSPCKTVLEKALSLEKNPGSQEKRMAGPFGGDVIAWSISKHQTLEEMPLTI